MPERQACSSLRWERVLGPVGMRVDGLDFYLPIYRFTVSPFFTFALLSDELSQYFWVLTLSVPFLATWTPFILFHFSVAPFLDPTGCGSSCLLYRVCWLSSINLWSSHFLWSFPFLFLVWVYIMFYLILLLCGAFGKENREEHEINPAFLHFWLYNLRSIAIGFSFFWLLKIRKLTCYFLRDTWRFLEKTLHFYTFLKWIEWSIGISTYTSYCQMFVAYDWIKILFIWKVSINKTMNSLENIF